MGVCGQGRPRFWKLSRAMNIILFEPCEIAATAPGRAAIELPRADERAAHILGVLRRQPGDVFDAGIIDGPRGKGTLAAIGTDFLTLTFSWEEAGPPPLAPITLVIGMPRPQTARKILCEATALGVSEMHFVATGRGEPSYARSTLWTGGEHRRRLVAGAAQAFCTRLPRITFSDTLAGAVAGLAAARPGARRVALDNYESPASLGATLPRPAAPSQATPGGGRAELILAFGAERGWTAGERELLRAARFEFAHLGPRVLRTETAVTAAVALALASLGLA